MSLCVCICALLLTQMCHIWRYGLNYSHFYRKIFPSLAHVSKIEKNEAFSYFATKQMNLCKKMTKKSWNRPGFFYKIVDFITYLLSSDVILNSNQLKYHYYLAIFIGVDLGYHNFFLIRCKVGNIR